MMDITELLQIIGDTFFGGNAELAGVVVYSILIMVVLALTRKAFITLVVSLPITFVFSELKIIPTELMILLIIVAVLGMAYTSRNIWKD